MAWTFIETFDDIADGDLTNDGAWATTSATVNKPTVQTTVKFAGAKGLYGGAHATTNLQADYATITAVTSGRVYYAYRMHAVGSAGDGFFLQLKESTTGGGGYVSAVKSSNSSGDCQVQYIKSGGWANLFTATLDTWYIISFEFDTSTDQVKIYYKEAGGSWSDTGWQDCYSATASVESVRVGGDHKWGWDGYIDEISDTDPDAGGTDYPMTASVGAFTLTGNAVTLNRTASMPASVGEMTLTGVDVTFGTGKGMVAETGSFALTGNSVNLPIALSMPCTVGEFTLTGNDVTFSVSTNYSLSAETGAFTITGIDIAYGVTLTMPCTVGEFALAGADARLKAGSWTKRTIPSITWTKR